MLIAQRVIAGLLLLLAVIVLNFFLLRAAPGDAVDALISESGGASQETIEAIRRQFGLDRPVGEQLWRYIANVAQGNLGYSFHHNRPVLDLILSRLPVTAALGLAALFLATTVGTMLGVLAAYRPRGFANHTVTVLSLLGYATPAFWLGMIVLMVFSHWIPAFPAFGMRSVPPPPGGFAALVDIAYHLALPVLTLSVLFLASYSRLTRASMLDVLGSDYIRTARAKGLNEGVVLFKHALRNAALPIVTMIGLHMGNLLSGAVLVETVFSLPGIGPLLYESILRRDYPVMLGVLIVAALMVIVANVATDIAYRLVDPRMTRREHV